MDKKPSRGQVIVGALLVQLCLGAIYAWATFTPMLQASKAELAATLKTSLLGLDAKEQAAVRKAFAPLKAKAADPRGTVKKAIIEQINIYSDPVQAANDKIKELTTKKPGFDASLVRLSNKAAGFSDAATVEVSVAGQQAKIDKFKADAESLKGAKEDAAKKIKALSAEIAKYIPETPEKILTGINKDITTNKILVANKIDAAKVLKELGAEIKAGVKLEKADKGTESANANIGLAKKVSIALIEALPDPDAKLKEYTDKGDSAKPEEKAAAEALAKYIADKDDKSGYIAASGIIKKSKDSKFLFHFTADQAQYPFMLGLLCFALTTILGGRWQDKAGPKTVAITGGLILGIGYIAGSFAGTSLLLVTLCIGAIGGIGIGLGYVCPIACCVKWFPDKKGLVTGLAVAGFGAGAYVFIKVGASLVNAGGVNHAFLILGIIFAIGVVLGSLLLSNPPAGFKPAGWNPPAPAAGAVAAGKADFTQKEMLGTPTFWMIWLAFMLSAGTGLMIIGSLSGFAINQGGLDAGTAAQAIGLLALFNGLGRVVWGTLGQKLGPKMSLIIMTLLQGIMLFMLLGMGSSATTLTIAACWVGFNFGGNFALFPLFTADFFGTKNLGANYGFVFTAYGIGGLVGPYLAGKIWVLLGSYQMAFIPAGCACLFAMLMGILMRAPSKKAA